MCRSEIIARFGSNEVADQMIAAKTTDAEISKSHVRPNPDLHGMDTDDSWWIQIDKVYFGLGPFNLFPFNFLGLDDGNK